MPKTNVKLLNRRTPWVMAAGLNCLKGWPNVILCGQPPAGRLAGAGLMRPAGFMVRGCRIQPGPQNSPSPNEWSFQRLAGPSKPSPSVADALG